MNEYEKSMQQVRSALNVLGVKGDAIMQEVSPGDMSKLEVFVNGEHFGIFDTEKNEFID